MKNKFIAIFAFYFLFASLGVVYGTHSCGTKSSNSVWGVSLSKENACKCKHESNSKHKKDCCKSTHAWIKAKTDLSKQQIVFKLSKVECTLIYLENITLTSIYTAHTNFYKVSHSPPLQTTPSFIKFRSLLI